LIKRSLVGLTLLTQLYTAVPPGMAQIVSSPQAADADSSGPTTWSQTPGGGDAWAEGPPSDMPPSFNLGYNVWRAVPKNASLGRSLKFGDLKNTRLPNGRQYFKDGDRSISELLRSQGQDPKNTSVGDSSYTAGLTLGEVIQANGGKIPPALERSLLQEMGSSPSRPSSKSGSGADLSGLRQAGATGGSLVKLLSDNPVIKEIPLSELASGDFQGALDIGIQRGAQEAMQYLPPAWKDLPVGSIVGSLASGDFKGALREGLNYGGQKLAKYILSSDALKNLPIGAFAKNLPISELGNLATAPLSTLPRIGSQYLSKIPGLKNATVIQAGITAFIAIAKGDIAVQLDVAYAGKKENPKMRAFTGGTPNNTFASTPCVINSPKKKKGKTSNCAHFEMGRKNVKILEWEHKGKGMVDGSGQWAKGGKGWLAKVNGGWEPTGWKPFGDAAGYNPAKLSIKNIKEYPGKNKPASANIQVDLQITVKFWGKTHSTPHFIPVPAPNMKAVQGGWVPLLINGAVPKDIQKAIDSVNGSPAQCDLQRQVESGNQNTKYGHKAYDEVDQKDLRQVRTGGAASGRTESLHKDAATSFDKMRADAASQGVDLYAISGFRSTETQQQLWDQQVQRKGSEELAAKVSAPPGHSEHSTGYAVDFGTSPGTDLQPSFEQTKAYGWLKKNSKSYGFEQSFTGKANQGADNEPWHFRYVGSTESRKTFSGSGEINTSAPTKNTGKTNQTQYLARIAAGESSGGVNLGAVPQNGSDAPYGEYQFRASTRQAVLDKYPGLDAWSTNKATRDKATLAWIGLYGNDIGVDILGNIQKGDFASADAALGKDQFTSLPGGAEASPLWSSPGNLVKYGPGGAASSGSLDSANCSPPLGAGVSLGAYNGQTSGTFMDPTNGKGPLTSGFGPRSSPCSGCSSNHMGVDFGVQDGTPIVAVDHGKIVYQGYLSGYGNTVFIDHGNGTMTQYSHLQEYIGGVGTNVPQGATIALSGRSGLGTGPHLHFGVLQGTSGGNIHSGQYVDPLTFLKK